MALSGRRRWTWLISAVGLLVWGGFLWNFAVEVRTLPVVWPPVLALFLGTGLSFALVYAGYRLGREDWIDAGSARRIVGWGVGGLVLVSGLRLLTILIRLSEGRTLAEPQLDVLVSLAGGMVGGTLVGYLNERARDRTERMREARDALAFLNRTLRHECLNGLNVVLGNVERVSGEIDDENARNRLAVVRSRATDMADMVRSIRGFANAFGSDDRLERVDISDVLSRRISVVRETHPDATVTGDFPPDVHVRANQTVEFVLKNVLENAIEHNDKADPEITVTLDSTPQTVTVRVADNGPGIPESRRERLFEPDLEREHRFGLYIAKTLVDSYGGDISVSDNDPDGTVVAVRLPHAESDADVPP